MTYFDNSIRNRLLLAFLLFSLIIIFLSGASFVYLNKVEQLNRVKTLFTHSEANTLQILNHDYYFLQNEVKDQSYYLQGTTPTLEKRQEVLKELKKNFTEIRSIIEQNSLISPQRIDNALILINKYDSSFQKIQNLQLVRGFKDAGLEGNMRNFAHELENNYSIIPMKDILMLRRHEKDFFLRGEQQYVDKLNDKVKEVLASLSQTEKSSRAELLLANYQKAFNRIVMIDRKLGVMPGQGLKGYLEGLTSELGAEFNKLATDVKQSVFLLLSRLKILYTITCLVCIALSILISYTISNRLAKPIQRLARKMSSFILHNNFNEVSLKPSPSNPKEIRNLTSSYLNMVKEIRSQYRQINEKSASLETQNAELKKLNQELDRFIYSTSHDLRSPLASLLGLITLTKGEVSNQEATHYLELMENSVSRLDATITEIVQYYKNKNTDVSVSEVFPNTLVRDIVDNFKYQEGATDIDIQIQIPENFSLLIDEKRLKIILENLISNAIRYQDKNKKDQRLIVRSYVRAGFAYLAVEDNGVGIPENLKSKVFQMFFRASENTEGSGLGLFLVKETAKKLKGDVMVTSQIQKGSTFTLKLPLQHQKEKDHFSEKKTLAVTEAE